MKKINIFRTIVYLTLIFFALQIPFSVKSEILINPEAGKEKNFQVNARCAIAMDSQSNIVLYEKNAQMLVPMASTTKIVTTLVALKYGNLDKKIEISERAANIHGSTVGYKKGEFITLKELLYGLMLRSGNDAAIAIAEGVSGSVDEFVKLMNEYAAQIGICNTHFESPHGLDSEKHYSTAYDLAKATSKAKEIKLFNEIVQSKSVDGKVYGFTRSYANINKILWQLPEANGVKTGFTGNAGKCLVTSVNIHGRDVIIVVLNCYDRWKQTIRIKKYVEDNYEIKNIAKKGEILAEIPVKSLRGKVKIGASANISLPIKTGCTYETKVVCPSKLSSSVNKGDKVGSIYVYQDKELIYIKELIAQNTISEKNNKIFRIINKIS